MTGKRARYGTCAIDNPGPRGEKGQPGSRETRDGTTVTWDLGDTSVICDVVGEGPWQAFRTRWYGYSERPDYPLAEVKL